jgi:hypothetical protein
VGAVVGVERRHPDAVDAFGQAVDVEREHLVRRRGAEL